MYCGKRTDNSWFSFFASFIKFFTSYTTHIGMVVKDRFTEPKLKGVYIWQSGWEGTPDPQDERIKLGVQLTPLKRIKMIKKDNTALLDTFIVLITHLIQKN